MWSDPRGGQAADEGDTAEAHLPEEGGAGGLHDEVLQKDPQLCEQGAAVETDLFSTLTAQESHSEVLHIFMNIRPQCSSESMQGVDISMAENMPYIFVVFSECWFATKHV